MASSPHPERIRDSWQQRRLSGAPAKAWLVLRRTVATLVALGLIAVCAYLLFTLIWAPKSYLVHLSAGTYSPLSGQPVLFTRGDAAALKELEPAFATCDVVDAFETPLTKRFLEEKLADLANSGMREKDTVIVYLTAHGIVRGNEASLLCERSDGGAGEDPLPVTRVLEALARSSAGTKLLILDAGREGGDSPAGAIASTFPKVLEDAINELQDPSLWVLSANAPLERSHVSHALGQSVMGFIVAKGLGGLADQNGDKIIRLDELYGYVQAGVSAWVDQISAGNESQTPTLFNCEAARLATDAPVLVSVKWLPEAKELNVREELEQSSTASLADRAGSLRSMAPAALQQAADKLPSSPTADAGTAAAAAPNEAQNSATPADQPATPNALQAGVNYGGFAEQQLSKAWQESAKLEQSSSWANPSYVAPPLWRAFLDRLLWYEQFAEAEVPADGEAAWRPAVNELSSFDQSLTAYSKPETQPSSAGNVVQRIQAFAPKVPLKTTPSGHISIALLELIASRSQNVPIPKEFADFVAAYDALLAKETSTATELAALLEKSKETLDPSSFYELRLHALAQDFNVPWNLTRLALHTRRMGEQVAANMLCGQGWSQQTVEEADRLRWEGERLIADRTNSTWPELAEAKLLAARAKYEQAAQELSIVRNASDDRNVLLRQLPQYVRWAHLGGPDRSGAVRHTEALKELIVLLTSLDEALSQPGGEALGRLEQLHGQLVEAREALDNELDPSGSSWRIANLLSTTLPTADRRQQLQDELQEAEKTQMSAFTFAASEQPGPLSSTISDRRWNEIREQLDLELAYARLAGCDEALAARLEQILSDESRDRWQRLADARQTLRELHVTLPASIETIPDVADLRDPETRPQRLAALQSALRHWLLLNAQHHDEINQENNLIAALSDAAWYDLLHWQSQRFERSSADAPLAEVEYLRNAATQYRRLAADVPQQPPLEAPPLPQLAIDASETLSLVANDEVRLPFTVQSLTTEEMPVWLVVQYNGELLEVEGPGVSSQDALRAAAAETSRNRPVSQHVVYPYRPDQLAVDGMRLSPGASADHTLRVKRRTGARGTTKLILKAISGDTYVRRELHVELPGLELLHLAVDAGRDFWTETNQGVVLHPLPNHNQDFSFNIVNRERVSKKLEISFVIPSRAPDSESPVVLPMGALRPDTANQLLEPFKPFAPLGPAFPIDLPASGEPVRVKLTATPDKKLDPQANLLVPDPAKASEFKGVPLRHGLLVIARDLESGDLTIRRVEIAPQRPRRYLNAVASYDASTDRVQIDVTAANENAIPPEGVRVAFRIVEGVSAQQEKRLEAVLKSPDYSARLYAFLGANAPQDVTAVVDADDYPRAFTFNITRGATDSAIRPADDAMGVRFVTPSPRSIYRAPVDMVAATLEVDAPEGSFGDEGSSAYVEVGVDIDRDGELREEQALVLKSDRQIEVAAKALSPGGSLTLDTRVGDFRLELPSTGLSDLSADLRGHVVSPLGGMWSEPVEVVFDGAGPRIRDELVPGRVIERGSDLLVRVFADSPDLSGIQLVEAVFDALEQAAPASDGGGAEAKPAWIAALRESGESWVATLKTEKLALGRHTVLIRAKDKVGNPSEVLREEVDIVEKKPVVKPTPAQDQAQQANTVTGSVMYYDERVPDARVVLESAAGPQIAPVTSGSDGGFTFRRVPPGAYTVKSEKVISNRNRKAEVQITVPPRPKPVPAVTLKLGQPS